MTLTDLILLALAGLAINQWWRSRDAKAVALMYAAQRCQLLGLQLHGSEHCAAKKPADPR